jgi:hypothetical protein
VIDIKASAAILGTDDNNARVILRFFKVRTEKSEVVNTPKAKNLYDEVQVRAVAALPKF